MGAFGSGGSTVEGGEEGTWGLGGLGGNMNWWLAASRVLTQDHQLLHSLMRTLYASGADIMVGRYNVLSGQYVQGFKYITLDFTRVCPPFFVTCHTSQYHSVETLCTNHHYLIIFPSSLPSSSFSSITITVTTIFIIILFSLCKDSMHNLDPCWGERTKLCQMQNAGGFQQLKPRDPSFHQNHLYSAKYEQKKNDGTVTEKVCWTCDPRKF